LKERQAAAQEHVIREQSHGRCPQCGEPLHERTIHGVTALECVPCQGIWLNKDQLPTMTHPSGSEWLETFLRGLGWWRSFNRN
jgi:ribosomal protein L37AE/L43A